jgi:protein-S-isoprenylcysteine O-methyltransferase Ste14
MRAARPSPPALFFLSLLVMEALHVLTPGPQILPSPWTQLGWIPVAAGVWLHAVGYSLFRRRKTTLATLEKPRLLVTDGPFRLSRNPMYASGVLILGGVGALLGSTLPFLVPVLFGALALRWFILPEEELLAGEFGEDYAAYRSRVRRWL